MFDIAWVTVFCGAIALSYTSQTVLRTIDIFAISSNLVAVTMFFSPRFKEVSKVCFVVHWISMNILFPRTKYNPYFWALFICVMSILGIINEPRAIESELMARETSSTDMLWVFGVLLSNVLIGFWVAREHKNEST